MSNESNKAKKFCNMCVYFPPNLPEDKYPQEDWLDLQQKSCSFDYAPGDADCLLNRKTSCSLMDLENPCGKGTGR
ncbi:hypothetical protein HER14_03955 [Acidithiobacillus thiooxidans]|nr:hypothetical protein [Acidithiobacillus thiooxidans]